LCVLKSSVSQRLYLQFLLLFLTDLEGHEECQSMRQIFNLDDKHALVRENNKTRIVKRSDIKQEPFKFTKILAGIEVNHSKVLDER